MLLHLDRLFPCYPNLRQVHTPLQPASREADEMESFGESSMLGRPAQPSEVLRFHSNDVKIRSHPLTSSLQVTRHRFTVVLCYIRVPRSSTSKAILYHSDGQKYIIAHGAIKKIFQMSGSI
jgi:hypothetical protein